MKRSLRDIFTASVWFFRSLRQGDWLWLVIAILVASMSVTLIKQLGDSVQQSMLVKAANSLGADLVIRSTRPIDIKYQKMAHSKGLQTRNSISVVTMALAKGQFQLISLKGVSQLSPLRGKVIPQNESISASAKVWIEPKLKQLLKLTPGDSLTLGNASYTFSGTLEPNVLINPMAQFAPQAVMLMDDFENTGLLGPGSRASYELQLAGDSQTILEFQQQIKQILSESSGAKASPLPWTIISAKAPSEDLGKTLDRAWLFLDLASLSAVLIAGMSILIASRFYLNRWQNTMALLRAYGADNARMFRLFAGQLFWLSFLSSLLGALLGLLIAWLLQPQMANFFDPFIMTSAWTAFFTGTISGILVLWSFAWHALTEALKTSPMRLLRSVPRSQTLYQWGFSFLLLLSLIALMVGQELLLWVFIGLTLLSVTLWIASEGLTYFMNLWQQNSRGWLKIAISSLLKEKKLLSIQLISVGVVLFVLMLMTFVRQDLMQTWQKSLPDQAPNTFLMNIQPDQKPQTAEILAKHNLQPPMIAMARGRLVEINDKIVSAQEQISPRAQRMLRREANIAIMQKPPEYNQIIETLPEESNPDQKSYKVSVEQGIAELFNIRIGDRLTFDFQGQKFRYQVSSIRQVEWQSFQLNFFFIVEPRADALLPISYISNFYLDNSNQSPSISTELTQQLASGVPGVLFIDVRAIIEQLEEIMNQASWAVSGLYLFTLIASFLVLFTATLASQQSRIQSWFLLRSLGATQNIITKVGLTEFILIGFLAGFIAASFAQFSSWLISTLWFEQTSPFSWQLWFSSLGLGIGLLITIAWLTQRQYMKKSALELKRYLQN